MFAVQFVLTIITIQCTVYVRAMNMEDIVHPGYNHPSDEGIPVTENDGTNDELSAEWINELLNSTDEFFAGEDTPVWTAYRANLSPRAKEMTSSVIEETSRSMADIVDNNKIETATEGSSDYPIKVVHPSVLVMMDYVREWPVDKMDQEKLINERILYALAFWKGVDLHFRHVLKPKIRLRISGIIIAMNKRATPYVYDQQTGDGLNMRGAYTPMLEYWRALPEKEGIFPLEGYHMVATMTNSTPSGYLPDPAHAIASLGPACYAFGANVAGLIFPDDLAFGGLNVAVHETGHTLGVRTHDGDSEDCPAVKGYVMVGSASLTGRNFSECALRQISNRIKFQGSCVEQPREFQPPGKPIEHILPGKLTPASKQCKDRGWEDGIVCWDRMTCKQLYCRNDHWWSWCRDSGIPVDGTTCKPGKICLDEKCVSLNENLHDDPLSVLPVSL